MLGFLEIYNMKKRIIRIVCIVIVGVIISTILASFIHNKTTRYNLLMNNLCSIVITFLVWEGNLYLDKILNKKLSWQKSVLKRILIQLLTSVPYTIATIYFSLFIFNSYICKYPEDQHRNFLTPSILIGVITSIIILLIEIGAQFFINWKKSLIEIEKHKVETSQIQLQNLKNQINPHFLFNNLSVLSSLVYSDQDKAVDFINQLSKVYRYILENRESELATLESEMTFIDSYIFLLKIRFQKNIQFEISIEQGLMSLLLPPMSLQILVENAIKHNEISTEQPLNIKLYTEKKYLVVQNNFQLRKNHEPSSKTGIQNIKDRYEFFTKEEVEIQQTEKFFIVKIPLLPKK